ncbi:MAG TPA: DUF1249 domain-containing protein [Steroidobacteraceae bacterium]|nr:DUF1249 domain-containing protein [Steroidobacteraceae bacterium]
MLLADTQTVVSWRARPRSFVALMGLYESNFIRLGWLAGSLRSLARGRYASTVRGDCDLVLTVIERSAYTSTLNLTYMLPGVHGLLRCPDLRVRIYHDAHLAEAQPGDAVHTARPPRQARAGARPAFQTQRSRAERELHQRWARNMMLNKWLEYCVERGHRFSSSVEPGAGA